MNIFEYSEEIKRTCPHLESEFNDQLHMVIGISTEANELLDTYKKKFAYNKELDKTNIAEEMGDIFWYTINLCNMFDINPEDIFDTNIKKLRARYPEKFTQENAINRDLITERKILEELGF